MQSMQASLSLRPFDPRVAEVVASWVSAPQELFNLAPTTAPPLTAAKVIAWTRSLDHPLILWNAQTDRPCGYAELNPMRSNVDHLWIGHAVVDPAARGQGLGTLLVRKLLHAGFERMGARRVVLVVFPDNEPAVRCYRKVGFELRREEYHRFGPEQRRHRMLRFEMDRSAWVARGRSGAKQPLRCLAQSSPGR